MRPLIRHIAAVAREQMKLLAAGGETALARPQAKGESLRLTPICSDDPATFRRWEVANLGAIDATVT